MDVYMENKSQRMKVTNDKRRIWYVCSQGMCTNIKHAQSHKKQTQTESGERRKKRDNLDIYRAMLMTTIAVEKQNWKET